MADNQTKLTINVDENNLSFEIEGDEASAILGLAYGIVRTSVATEIPLPRLLIILHDTARDLGGTLQERCPEEDEK